MCQTIYKFYRPTLWLTQYLEGQASMRKFALLGETTFVTTPKGRVIR